MQSAKWKWVLTSLINYKSNKYSLKVVDTVLFEDGEIDCWIITDEKYNTVTKFE